MNDTAVGHRNDTTRSLRAVLSIALLAMIWGHYEVDGSTPAGSRTLVTRTTLRVWWSVPYWSSDPTGARVAWPGLALGVASTLLVALLWRRGAGTGARPA